jgi:hypothetical protein
MSGPSYPAAAAWTRRPAPTHPAAWWSMSRYRPKIRRPGNTAGPESASKTVWIFESSPRCRPLYPGDTTPLYAYGGNGTGYTYSISVNNTSADPLVGPSYTAGPTPGTDTLMVQDAGAGELGHRHHHRPRSGLEYPGYRLRGGFGKYQHGTDSAWQHGGR